MDYQSNKELWNKRVSDFQQSGLAITVWCQENQISVSTLRYWIRKIKGESEVTGSPEWVQLNISERVVATAVENAIKVHVGNFRIEIGEGFDKSVFVDVVKALTTIC